MSSPQLLSPRLLTLVDFGGDLGAFLKHVDQYRQYTILKKQMEKVKSNLSLRKTSQPSVVNTNLESDDHSSEQCPVDSTILSPSSYSSESLSTINSQVDLICFFSSFLLSEKDSETEPDVRVRVAPVVLKSTSLFDHTEFTEHLDKAKKHRLLLQPVPSHDLATESDPKTNLGDIMSKSGDAFVSENNLKIQRKEELTKNIGKNLDNGKGMSTKSFIKSSKGFLTCSLCGKILKSMRTMTHHIKNIHFKAFISKCHRCRKSFTTKHYYSRHYKNDCLTGLIKLKYRKKTKARIKLYNANQIDARKAKDLEKCDAEGWLCGICECKYKTCQYLKKHIKEKHSGKKTFSCISCSKCYNSRRPWWNHTKLKHNKNGVLLYPCAKQGCQNMLKDSISLKRHMN